LQQIKEKDKQLDGYKKRIIVLEKENRNLKIKQTSNQFNKRYSVRESQAIDPELEIALEQINQMESKKYSNNLILDMENKNKSSNILPNFEPNDILDALYHTDDLPAEVIDPVKEYEDNLINEICPNPDQMTYEQLLELEDKVGKVNKGFTLKDIEVKFILYKNIKENTNNKI
jgi:hypothetical protein